MFNFSKVGEKVAIIDKSLKKYKRQNKIYMNNKSSDDEFIKEFKVYRLMMVSLCYHLIKT